MKHRNRFASVWDAIEPAGDAARLKARAEVAHVFIDEIERRALTRSREAALCGTTQLCISSLMRGRLDQLSLDALIDMADRIGFQVDVKLSRRRAA